MLTSMVVVLVVGWRRAGREGAYPFLPVAAALLAVFLLWNKVHSPQYSLWLLPFLVLLPVHWAWWAAYTANDLVLYGLVFYAGPISLDWAQPWLALSVLARAGLLLGLAVAFLRSRAERAEEGTWQAGTSAASRAAATRA
jgi:hypothetical protein